MKYNLEKAINMLKSGDESAFAIIYDLTNRKIFYVALNILKDKSLAEDIMQDTYLKFLEKLYDYKSKNSLAYILTIARNLAINTYNKRKREISYDDDFDNYFGIEDYVEFKIETEDLILKALKQLKLIEKQVFLLHTLENLRHREIALILDKPLGTITWTYKQAIKKLKDIIKDD